MAVGEKRKRKKTTAAELPEELKRNGKKTTAAELPEELIRREILTRLPIKSVVRFKCVSKLWLSLFSNPQFIKQHLTLNISQSPNDYDCLLAKKDNKVVILSRYKETLALPCSGYFRLIGCARGLVCLYNEPNLLLWNPAIHQYKEFTLPPRRARDCYFKPGFGYDRVSRNYMVVFLSLNSRSAIVWYSNSDNWIDISVPGNVFGDNRGRCMGNPITMVKDWPNWTVQIFEDEMPWNIDRIVSTGVYFKAVKFDSRSNEFKSLPELYFDLKARGQDYAFTSEFVDMNDCLSLIVYDRNSECMLDIYSLVGEEGCCVWSKMYSIGPLDFGSENWFVSQGFYGGEIVLCGQGMFSCYDHKTDTIKCLSKTYTIDPYVRCFRYRPSLVFLEGMKSVYLTTQTRARGTSGLCFRVPRRLIKSLRTKSFA